MLSGKHNAVYAVEDCVVAFLRFWALLHLPSGEDYRLASLCAFGLTIDKLEYGQGNNKALWTEVNHYG